ncbi:exo-beta-N-acetylmuramidase NamZ domain-containing protein [Tundrisphaera sp. TA3]|uniref:exo-beta-N-acetylmuramidase NamZ domain-containing protein n=1 Tax=Tundrisphaera sp. TA3 TaxID=3435775 RepID=UPI003EBC7E17
MRRHAPTSALLFLIAAAIPARAGVPEASPESLGLDPAKLDQIGEAVDRTIAEKKVPGAVVVVGRHGKIALVKVAGKRSVEPTDEAMTRDTIFDMASLTKPVATASSVMALVEQGKVKIGDVITTYLPEMTGPGGAGITVEQLLRHRSGLIADNPIGDYKDGVEKAWANIAALRPLTPPGEKFLYSDVNFEILGRLVEKVSGKPLDVFARETIFAPAGMVDAHFRPLAAKPGDLPPVGRIAPTEPENGTMIRGVVHDPRSRALGGVAGHAGLFGTADDLAAFAAMLLDGGRAIGGSQVLAPWTVRAMTSPGGTPEGQLRGLGWDIATSFSSPKGRRFGSTGFGHTGFTGTSIWADPETDCFVIILTSRLHPGGGGSPSTLRSDVATLAAEAVVDGPSKPDAAPARPEARRARPDRPVDCGVDVLISRNFRELQGKSVGLVTNHTGRTRDGVATIDVLHDAPGVKLVALFSPEHGLRGLVDKEVGDDKDEKTGLPIYSLYGKTRKPTAETLKGVDVLVYDIQDIGARFYTYISTMGLVLEAGKENNIPVVILDRPNPIGGEAFAGPVRDPEFASFIAFHEIPVRHGMTIGELAKMFNAERKIGADLTVIPCEGWRRAETYDRTGLTWVNPSPNMRSLTEALLYPGIALPEFTNLATGRGTDTPFERVGAPYIDERAFARKLNEMGLPGVRFIPSRFTPKERQFANQECRGVQILITEWAAFDPIDAGMGILVALRSLYPDQWQPAGLQKMLADTATYEGILAGKDVAALRAGWAAELAEFGKNREKYLLYK